MEQQTFIPQTRDLALAQARMHVEIAKAQLSRGEAQLGLANAVRAYILALKLEDAYYVLADAQYVVCRHLCHYKTLPDHAKVVFACFKADLEETCLATVFLTNKDHQDNLDPMPGLFKECIDLAADDPLFTADVRLCIAGMWQRRGWSGDPSPSLRLAFDAYIAAGDLAGQAHCAHVVSNAQWSGIVRPISDPAPHIIPAAARTLMLLENSARLYEACCMTGPAANVLCKLAWWYVDMSSLCVGGVPVEDVQIGMARNAIRSAQRAHALSSGPLGASLGVAKHVWGCAHYVLARAPSLGVVERALHWRVAIVCMEEALGRMGRELEIDLSAATNASREVQARAAARCCMDLLTVIGERGSTPVAPSSIPGTELAVSHQARLLAWTESLGGECVAVLEAASVPEAPRYRQALAKARACVKSQ